jgi:hypothetical protein
MEAIQLLKEAYDALTFNLEATNLVDGLFTVKELKFARVGSIVIVDGVNYPITAVNSDLKQFQVSDETLNTLPTTLELKKPYFAHGTAQMQNNEWANAQFDDQKFPSIYVREVIREQEFTYESGSSLDRESAITIYFLDSVNFAEWTTQDHYDYIIPELRYIKNAYKQQIIRHKQSGRINTFDSVVRVNFGVYTDQRGNTQAVFNDRLSAIELGFTLPIYIDFKTNCNT